MKKSQVVIFVFFMYYFGFAFTVYVDFHPLKLPRKMTKVQWKIQNGCPEQFIFASLPIMRTHKNMTR